MNYKVNYTKGVARLKKSELYKLIETKIDIAWEHVEKGESFKADKYLTQASELIQENEISYIEGYSKNNPNHKKLIEKWNYVFEKNLKSSA